MIINFLRSQHESDKMPIITITVHICMANVLKHNFCIADLTLFWYFSKTMTMVWIIFVVNSGYQHCPNLSVVAFGIDLFYASLWQ